VASPAGCACLWWLLFDLRYCSWPDNPASPAFRRRPLIASSRCRSRWSMRACAPSLQNLMVVEWSKAGAKHRGSLILSINSPEAFWNPSLVPGGRHPEVGDSTTTGRAFSSNGVTGGLRQRPCMWIALGPDQCTSGASLARASCNFPQRRCSGVAERIRTRIG
jgi:hypothetical protein